MQEAGAYVGQYRAAHRKRIEPRNYLEKADEVRETKIIEQHSVLKLWL